MSFPARALFDLEAALRGQPLDMEQLCGRIHDFFNDGRIAIPDMGGNTHLFSFFPEGGSPLADRLPPPIDQYRRIQLARWLIDSDLAHERHFTYNDRDALTGYGISRADLDTAIDSGEPFRTCGCTGRDGEVACNRPYANSRPGPGIRNYPFKPEDADVRHIRLQLGLPA